MARPAYQQLFEAIDSLDPGDAGPRASGAAVGAAGMAKATVRPSVEIPEPLLAGRDHPSRYDAGRDLRAAAKVAIVLGKPLLLTGEPGSGKTQFAAFLSWRLGLGERPLIFETKSTSIGRDLFYTYNTLARFHAAQVAHSAPFPGPAAAAAGPLEPREIRDAEYIHYNALGEAILRTRKWEEVRKYLPPDMEAWKQPSRSVVLIDEIDKAPRDFPNDILNEVEHLYFRISEMNNVRIDAAPSMPPVLVLTSNSEKNLPDAFLRRCVYYNIPFPDDRLADIVEARLGSDLNWRKGSSRLKDALELFHEIRILDLDKRPGTGELLDWLLMLHAMSENEETALASERQALIDSVGTLVKSENDRARASRAMDLWIARRQ